jgi:hypothetical protein
LTFDGKGSKSLGKLQPMTCHEETVEEQRYSSTLSLTSALIKGGCSTPHLGRFIPGNEAIPFVKGVSLA